jgi:hypothetical protein
VACACVRAGIAGPSNCEIVYTYFQAIEDAKTLCAPGGVRESTCAAVNGTFTSFLGDAGAGADASRD